MGAGLEFQPEEATLDLLAALFLRMEYDRHDARRQGTIVRCASVHAYIHRGNPEDQHTARVVDKQSDRRPRRWKSSSCSSDEKRATRLRTQGVENRCEETIREKTLRALRVKPVKKNAKKKKAAHKEIRTKRPTWIGRIADVASELHIGERYVFQLAKQGFPRVKPGVYNIPKCFRWYVRYLQRKLVERAHPDDENGKGSIAGPAAGEMRHKLLSIETEMAAIALAEKREQLISIDKVRKDIEAIVVEIRTRILALPPRLAAEVLGESDLAVSQVKIERSLKRALESLSQFDPDDDFVKTS
jgi:hypothetical protein